MRTPRQRHGRRRTARQRGGMDAAAAQPWRPDVNWMMAWLKYDVLGHDFKGKQVPAYWTVPPDAAADAMFSITKKESQVYDDALAGAPDTFIQNRQFRVQNSLRYMWRTSTSLFAATAGVNPFADQVVGNQHDAGKNPARALGLSNVITAGITIDPANTSVGPDADPILYLREGGTVKIPLQWFGFDPAVITHVELGDFRSGTVKCVFHLGAKYENRVIDATKTTMGDVRRADGTIDWGRCGSKPINPTRRGEEGLGFLSSVAEATRAGEQLSYVAKTIGDICVLVSGLPSQGDLVNTLHGIPVEGGGQWASFATGAAAPPPQRFCQSSLDLSKCISTIAWGIDCFRQVMPSGLSPTGGFDYIPGTQLSPTPEAQKEFHLGVLSRSRATAEERFTALLTSVNALSDANAIFRGETSTGGRTVAGVKDQLRATIPEVQTAVLGYYDRLITEAEAIAAADGKTLQELSNHAAEALNSLTPTTTRLVSNEKLIRAAMIASNPKGFPWRGAPALPVGAAFFCDFPNAFAGVDERLARNRERLREHVLPPPSSNAAAAPEPAPVVAVPNLRLRRLQYLLDCTQGMILVDTATWLRLTSITGPDAVVAINEVIRQRCPPEGNDDDSETDDSETEDGDGAKKEEDKPMEGKESGRKRSREPDASGPRKRGPAADKGMDELAMLWMFLEHHGQDPISILDQLKANRELGVDIDLSAEILSQYERWLLEEEPTGDGAAAAVARPDAASWFNAFTTFVDAVQSENHGYLIPDGSGYAHERLSLIEQTDLSEILWKEYETLLTAAKAGTGASQRLAPPKTLADTTSESETELPAARPTPLDTSSPPAKKPRETMSTPLRNTYNAKAPLSPDQNAAVEQILVATPASQQIATLSQGMEDSEQAARIYDDVFRIIDALEGTDPKAARQLVDALRQTTGGGFGPLPKWLSSF
jgi:hypothetical protein